MNSNINLAYIIALFFLLRWNKVRCIPVDEGENIAARLAHLGERVYKEPSEKTGKLLEKWDPSSEVNPEELGEYAEGDILFPTRSRNGLVAESYRWPNGVIPYSIDGYFDSDSLNMILKAVDIYHKYTCIKFRKRTNADKDYVSIINTNTGCWSSVGRIGGKQELNIQSPSCATRVGTIIHELMHAAGFLHEHTRYERDGYVDIVWQNIRSGHQNNFDKAEKEKTTGYGVPYDFRSVMHYSNTAFSVNGRPTIIPKDSSKVEKMGQRQGFSKGDLTKINTMYRCPEKTDEVVATAKPDQAIGGGSAASSENSHSIVDVAQGILGWLFH